MGKLGTYKGKEILGIAVEIRNAAGGLNEAMKIDGEPWDFDEERVVAMRVKVVKHRHDKVKDTDGLRLVMVLDAEDATVIDEELVSEALDAQARRIEEAAGIKRLELQNEVAAAHDRGEHKKLVEDCPSCQAEQEAAAAEAAQA